MIFPFKIILKSETISLKMILEYISLILFCCLCILAISCCCYGYFWFKRNKKLTRQTPSAITGLPDNNNQRSAWRDFKTMNILSYLRKPQNKNEQSGNKFFFGFPKSNMTILYFFFFEKFAFYKIL